jgi:recombination protein RecT
MPQRELNRRGGQGNSPARGADATKAAVDTLNKYAADFATVLPSHLDAQQWLRLAAGLLRRSPDLAATALRNPASFFAALMDAARLGLNPGDTYHLVPIGGEVVGITDYTGEIELIYRAGMVRKIVCEVVYERDGFDFTLGVDDRPRHTVAWFGSSKDRGEMIGVYAYAELKDGGTSRVAILNRDEVEKIRAVSKSSKSGSSPWVQWPDRMWRKTAVKQLTAWVPSSAEFRVEQIRAETAVARTSIGAVPPTRDYEELPAPPMPIDATGANLDGPPPGMNPATGELPAEPARAVEDRPDVRDVEEQELPADAGNYDPTTEANFGGES